MPNTDYGFDGLINENQWAQMLAMASGTGSAVDSGGSLQPRVIANIRDCTVGGGKVFQDGILTMNSGPYQLAMPSIPSAGAGRWFEIVARRDWTANATTFKALPGPGTATAAVPSIYAAPDVGVRASDFQSTPGTLADVHLGWHWTNGTTIDTLSIDDRPLPIGRKFGSLADRTAMYGTSVSYLGRYGLQRRGAHWFNTDTGREERVWANFDDLNPRGVTSPIDSNGWVTVGSVPNLNGIDMTTDTRWANVPLTTGASAGSGGGRPQYRRMDGVVYMRGRVTGATTWGNLPAGFRPNQELRMPVLIATSAAVNVVVVDSDGTCRTNDASDNLKLNLSWVAEQ